jgi:hypothetical protein
MNCPVDGTELRVSDRQGVEIDYCPKCRGVWLDRGELDKVLERTARTPSADEPEDVRGEDDDEERGHGKRRRRRSLLDDLFDFDLG